MTQGKKAEFSQSEQCGHCGNTAPMEIVTKHSEVQSHSQDVTGLSVLQWDTGPVYELLKCPACQGVTLRSCVWNSEMPEEVDWERLYPVSERVPQGLPAAIQKEFAIAARVKRIDANLFGVQLGRVFEMAMHDRKAEGRTLHERLLSLANRGEIPQRLVEVASGLRKLRNIGAHGNPDQELTPAEVPIVEGLCVALLEYLYSAPHLVRQVAERLTALGNRKKDAT